MTISSSLNAGVTGLNVNSSKLATIADNIANSETYGYKRADVDFSAMALTPSKGSYTAGGARATSFRQITTQGSLITTNNATDMAVGGRGMIPVTTISAVDSNDGTLPFMMTTTGSFKPDENGVLRTVSGLALLGWKANADGTIPAQPRDSSVGLEPVVFNADQFAAEATTLIRFGANLPAIDTRFDSAGDPLDVNIEYFANLGTSETLTATFTPVIPATGQSNTWNLQFFDSATGAAAVAEFEVEFDGSRASGGSILAVTDIAGGTYDATTGELAITLAGGPLSVEIGIPGASTYLTQLSADFAPIAITKNGAPVGNVAGIEIDANGFLKSVYDTGFTRTIYQIPLGDVANPDGLTPLDNQAFAISSASGPVYFWDAGDGPTGTVIGYAREESTADIAGELTQLIKTQRAYASNAKVIQTVDEMLQETTNIKR